VAARSAADRRLRRRQIVAGIVVAGLLLSSGGAVVAVVLSSIGGDSTPAPSTVPSRPTVPDGTPAELVFPPAGETAPAGYPCPAEDGSSPRTTSFGGPPPRCVATTPDGVVDPEVDYTATMTTSVGDLVWRLDTERAPDAVNSFVVLARYGFFDGAPFDVITPLEWAEVGGTFTGNTGGTPGWTIGSEAPSGGMVATPGMLAMLTDEAGVALPGRLVVALGDGAGNLPVPTTFFGLLLDGSSTLAAVQRSGGPGGVPTTPVVVERIVVEASRGN
jgi:cyclophilin family peptidyl-prolyl cis-trans isomerase